MTKHLWKNWTKPFKHFRDRCAQSKARTFSRRGRLQLEHLEDRITPGVLDLTVPPNEGMINGAIFTQRDLIGAGTGLLQSFVRVQADTMEQGYNTDLLPGEKFQFDEKGGSFTHAIQLSAIPLVATPSGGLFYSFELDINQNTPTISLDELRLYLTNPSTVGPANLHNYHFDSALNTFVLDDRAAVPNHYTPLYDMDAGVVPPDDNWVKADANVGPGSGRGDMVLLVPVSVLGTDTSQFVYLYSKFGVHITTDDGFEEWAPGTPNVGTISGSKFSDLNRDGMQEPGEPPLSGVTIFLDANTNQMFDSGEASTTTDPSGNFSFPNIIAGTYHVREVVPSGYVQTTPLNPDEFIVTLAPGDTVSGLLFGNFTPVTPTVTTTANPTGTITLGTTSPTLNDSAVLADGLNPTGTLVFTLKQGSTTVFTQTDPVTGNGTYTTAGFTLPTTGTVTGTYTWMVHYSGDSNNNPADDQGGASEQVTVNAANPTVTTTANPTGTITLGATSPTLNDSAVLAGGFFPTGTITFTVTGPGGTYTDHVTVSGNGTYDTGMGDNPGGFTLPSTGTVTGTYTWTATYSGDTNNNTANDQGGPAEQVTVNKANPTVTTTANPTGTITLGTTSPTLNDSAVLAGGFFPTGTITFTVTGPGGTYTDHVTVSGNGTYDTSMGDNPGGFTLPTSGTVTGTYTWTATYSGDTNNNTARDQGGAAEQVTVNAANPTITTTANPTGTITLGTTSPTLNDSAVLAGGFFPTGTITFTVTGPGGTYTDHVTVSGNGTYDTSMGDNPGGFTLPTSGTVTGTYTWTATYSGDSNNNTARDQGGAAEQVTVNAANPTITTTANPTGTITLGTTSPTLNDSAVLAGGFFPTGTITFTVTGPGGTYTDHVTVSGNGTYDTSMGDNPGGFTLPTSGTVTGTYTWTATYSGDTNNNTANDQGGAAEQVTVNAASPTITTTANPTGTITLGTTSPTLNDSAVLAGGFFPTGTITFTVTGPGGTYTDHVTVSGNGTYDTSMGDNPGGFTLPTGGTVTGTYTWTATYSGDTNNNTANDQGGAAEQVTVNAASPTITTTANPTGTITLGTTSPTLNDSAVLAGGFFPTGTITFTVTGPGGTYTDHVTVSGNGTYDTSMGDNPGGFTLPTSGTVTGTYTWTATYSGDSNNNTARDQGGAAEQVTVNAANPTITTTANPTGTITLGTTSPTLNDSAVLAGGFFPTGTITFTVTGPGGTYTDHVTVSGNGTYDTSMGDNPGGFTLPTSGTVTGTYTWTATYSGDTNNNTANDQGGAAEQVTVSPASPAITTTTGGNVVVGSGAALTDSADLSGGFNPTGTITFTLTAPGGGIVDTEVVMVAGNGTYSTPTGFVPSAMGTYQWVASYSGDANNNPVASNFGDEPETAGPATPTVTTTANPTGTITLGTTSPTLNDSAVLAGGFNPTGTLVFTLKQGSTTVFTQTDTVTGNGTYTTAGFTLPTTGTVTGTYTWTVHYSGDVNNNMADDQGGASEQVTVNAANPTVTTTANPTGTITLGTTSPTLNDSAVLAGGFNPTGTLVFTLKQGSTTVFTQTDPVTGNGTYTTAGFTLPTTGTVTGTYTWTVTYSGDSNNNMADDQGGASEQVTVNSANPTIVTTANPTGTITLGTTSPTLNDSAVLAGGFNPTGTLVFTLKQGSTTVFTQTDPVTGNGTYSTAGFTLPTTGTVTGTYTWTVTYSGDTNNNTANDQGGAAEQVTVTAANPTVTTTANPTGTITLNSGGSPTLNDSAVLAGGFNPTGTIVFTLKQGSTTVFTQTDPVTGNGTYTTAGFTLPTTGTVTGTYTWTVTYSGDTNNNTANDQGGAAEQVTVTAANPTVTTTANPTGTITLNSGGSPTLNDSAVLAGGFNPTGTLVFTLKQGSTTVFTQTDPVTGNGTYTTAGFTLPTTGTVTGTYTWTVHYSGDSNNNVADDQGGASEQVTVNPASPAITTTPGGTVVVGSGAALTDSAVLSGGFNPTGTITFTLTAPGGGIVDTEVATVNGNGTYSTPSGFVPTASGTFQWVATYSGDSNNNSVASAFGDEPETVNPRPNNPVIQIVKAVNGQDANTEAGAPHVTVGSNLTFTYTVTNTGNVALSGVSVTDDTGLTPVLQSGDTNSNGLLDLNETWVFTASSTAVVGLHTNTGTARGTDAATGTQVTASNTANYIGEAFPLVLSDLSKADLLGSNFLTDENGTLLPNTIFVNSLYHTLLNRVPDVGGLDIWVQMLQAGVSRFQVVQQIWRSGEHRGIEVDQLYHQLLHRDADPAGRAGWVNALLAGASETDVAVAFVTSGEYQASHPTAASYLQGLYGDILGRAPDAAGEAGWEQALASGASRAAVARAFLTSGEFDLKTLDAFYVQFLGRHPDPLGQQIWLGQLQSGISPEIVAEMILASAEYFSTPH